MSAGRSAGGGMPASFCRKSAAAVMGSCSRWRLTRVVREGVGRQEEEEEEEEGRTKARDVDRQGTRRSSRRRNGGCLIMVVAVGEARELGEAGVGGGRLACGRTCVVCVVVGKAKE